MRRALREETLRTRCTAPTFGRTVEWHDALPSTQERAMRLAADNAPEGTVVVAETQGQGRGREGSVWLSPPGGLWFSLLLFPKAPADRVAGLTLVAAQAVRDTLAFDFCVPAVIKHPNDVMVGTKKIAGILAEATSRAGDPGVERLVMGIGLDVANELPAALQGIATRMADHLPTAPMLEDVLARILERFEPTYRAHVGLAEGA